jgi:hypothetical protein
VKKPSRDLSIRLASACEGRDLLHRETHRLQKTHFQQQAQPVIVLKHLFRNVDDDLGGAARPPADAGLTDLPISADAHGKVLGHQYLHLQPLTGLFLVSLVFGAIASKMTGFGESIC